MTPTRPLTHDLFKNFAVSFSIEVKEVVIYNLIEGIFFAKLICERDGQVTEIDARTSDAIAIGVRFNCPIYTFENILSSAGILLDEETGNEFDSDSLEDDEGDDSNDSINQVSIEELEVQLDEAIQNEDYELASKIRDEINKRTS
jgi:bifunctional DNase/RNase